MKSILVLGAQGMLGSDVVKEFASHAEVTAWDKEDLDVTDKTAVLEYIFQLKPEVIINCVGYTDVEGAENNRELARQLNAESVSYLVSAAKNIQAGLVHFSTEYVFDGQRQGGYSEQAQPQPISIYGKTKVEGEKYIRAYDRGYLVRSSWLYGKTSQKGKPRGKNFVDIMIEKCQTEQELKLVNDQFSKLTYTMDVARALRQLLSEKYEPGIYHLINEGVASPLQVAEEIFKIKNLQVNIVPVSRAQYESKAKRPQHGVLINTKFNHLRPWTQALREYLS